MSGLPVYVLLIALLACLGLFLTLQPRNKVLAAFVVLSSIFDLVPTVVGGVLVRDVGSVMLFVAYVQLLLRRRVTRIPTGLIGLAVKGMIAWAALCVAYGVLVDGYPMLLSLKAARQWILGYATFFVFLRLYETDPGAFPHLVKWLFRITLALMPVVVVQYILNTPILFGLVREYAGALRALPIFLPVIWLFMWHILARLFAAQRVRWVEQVYLVLGTMVTALTFTRGIYLASLATLLLLVVTLNMAGRLQVSRMVGYLSAGFVALTLLLASGAMDRVVSRFVSGISVLSGESTTRTFVDDVDTFSGRLKVVGERYDLVLRSNPVFGFAFVHENLVPSSVRTSLRYGGPIDTPEYQKMYALGMSYVMSLHQPDIGWADIVIDMGFPGLLLTLTAMAAVFGRQFGTVNLRRAGAEDFFWATAAFLQLGMLMLLMFNGNPYVHNVQLVCFMLASFVLCSREASSVRRPVPDLRQVLSMPP